MKKIIYSLFVLLMFSCSGSDSNNENLDDYMPITCWCKYYITGMSSPLSYACDFYLFQGTGYDKTLEVVTQGEAYAYKGGKKVGNMGWTFSSDGKTGDMTARGIDKTAQNDIKKLYEGDFTVIAVPYKTTSASLVKRPFKMKEIIGKKRTQHVTIEASFHSDDFNGDAGYTYIPW